jgi:hypothetical protein
MPPVEVIQRVLRPKVRTSGATTFKARLRTVTQILFNTPIRIVLPSNEVFSATASPVLAHAVCAIMDADPRGQAATALTLTLPAIVAVIACLRLWPSGLDPKEPRLIPSSIPFIGHAIGTLRHQQRYFEILRYGYCVGIAIAA